MSKLSAFKVAIRADAVRMLLPYICTEETRYYLAGIHIEAHRSRPGLLAVATDGHKMGVAYDDQGGSEGELPDSLIVRIPGRIRRALEGKPADGVPARDIQRWLVVEQDMVRVVLAATAAGALECPPLSRDTKAFAFDALIDGTFPDWRHVIPSKFQAGAPAFNAKYLEQIAASFAAIHDARDGMALAGCPGQPALLTFGGQPDRPQFFAVLMPIAASGVTGALPDWFDPAPAEKAAE